MKRTKMLIVILAAVMIAAMLSGCIAVEMKVNADGSCDVTYTIDTSQLQGMMSKSEVEESIKESVNGMNDLAGREVAKLKGVNEDKKKQVITASISITDVNKMADGSFFGTVKEYREDSGFGLDDMMDTKERSVDEEDIPDNLYLVYLPMSEGDEYGLIDVTIIVPGSIVYLTDGGNVEKNNEASFNGETPLVVFKKGGGGFPFWILPIAAAGLILYIVIKKKPSAAPIVSPPVMPQTPEPVLNSQVNAYGGNSPAASGSSGSTAEE